MKILASLPAKSTLVDLLNNELSRFFIITKGYDVPSGFCSVEVVHEGSFQDEEGVLNKDGLLQCYMKIVQIALHEKTIPELFPRSHYVKTLARLRKAVSKAIDRGFLTAQLWLTNHMLVDYIRNEKKYNIYNFAGSRKNLCGRHVNAEMRTDNIWILYERDQIHFEGFRLRTELEPSDARTLVSYLLSRGKLHNVSFHCSCFISNNAHAPSLAHLNNSIGLFRRV